MIGYLFKNAFFGSVNLLIVGLPGLGLFKAAEMYLGKSDLLIAVFVVPGLAYMILNKLIVSYQVDPDVGYWHGWQLGLSDAKDYVLLMLGR